jgi:hypothetical protein
VARDIQNLCRNDYDGVSSLYRRSLDRMLPYLSEQYAKIGVSSAPERGFSR